MDASATLFLFLPTFSMTVPKTKGDDVVISGEWVAGAGGKMLKQRVAIIEDKITSAGSYDQFGKADFYISAPRVSLEVPETVEKANESIGVGEGEINKSYEEGVERKIPVNVRDLLIAVVVAIFISFAARRRR